MNAPANMFKRKFTRTEWLFQGIPISILRNSETNIMHVFRPGLIYMRLQIATSEDLGEGPLASGWKVLGGRYVVCKECPDLNTVHLILDELIGRDPTRKPVWK